jgi:hypothetical protein
MHFVGVAIGFGWMGRDLWGEKKSSIDATYIKTSLCCAPRASGTCQKNKGVPKWTRDSVTEDNSHTVYIIKE